MSTTHGSRRQQAAWKAVSTLSGLAAAMATRQVLDALWPTGEDGARPPFNPADRRVGWPTAVAWAVAASVGAGVFRLVGERLAAAGWEAATGAPPPGIQE